MVTFYLILTNSDNFSKLLVQVANTHKLATNILIHFMEFLINDQTISVEIPLLRWYLREQTDLRPKHMLLFEYSF